MNTSRNQPIAEIEFVIVGDTLVPDDITAILGIPPTRSFTKGDVISNRPGGKRPWGLWALAFRGIDVQEEAEELLETLRGKEEAIGNLVDTMEVQVSIAIWWEPAEGQGGFTVTSATLAQLCVLSTRIDVYFPGHS